MMKLRILVAALALGSVAPAFAADAELDGSWDTKYGMVFDAYNPLQNANFLDSYQGQGTALGIGFQYNLAPTRAIRGLVNLYRSSDPSYDRKEKDLITGVTIEPFDAPGNSTISVGVGAAYIMRLGTAALAPYVGAGGMINFTNTGRDFEDKTLATNTLALKYDYSRTTMGLDASGLAGVEWRIHKMISIFAEYGVMLTLFERTSATAERKCSTIATGAVSGACNPTSYTANDLNVGNNEKNEESRIRMLQLSTGLTQGARLGLVAHF